MARSTAEIQADIAVMRRLIEYRLDDLRVPDRWWIPYALLAAGLGLGVVLSRVPLLRLVTTSTRLVQAGLSVASALAALGLLTGHKRRAA